MDDNYAKVIAIRTYMDEHLSPYTYRDDMEFEKAYKYVDHEAKSLAYINGEVYQISDSYIVYAISMLGCAEPAVIAKFLTNLKKRHPDLNIPDFDKDSIKTRLSTLKKYGFLFNISYVDNSEVGTSPEKTHGSNHSLFTAGKDATSLMNARLRKQVKPNTWLFAKPNDELLGIAASASIFSELMSSPDFVKVENAIFKGKYAGTVHLDDEFISEVDGQKYYVGMISAYLHKNSNYATDEDYEEIINHKLNIINDYLSNRTKKGIAKIILVCESNKDMVRMVNAIINSGAFEQDKLNNIHFTSAGLVSGYGTGSEDWFLHIVLDESAENGFRYELSPRFV